MSSRPSTLLRTKVYSDVTHLPIDLEVLRHNLTWLFGNPPVVPPTYAVVDVETTGFSPGRDKIWQIGFYMVKDGVPVFNKKRGLSFLLETSEEELLSNRFEIERLATIRMSRFAESLDEATRKAEDHYLSRFTGKNPPEDREQGLRGAADFLTMCAHNNYPIIGHNLVRFDIPFIETECEQAGVDYRFPEVGVVDTGMLIKAAELQRRVLDTEYGRPLSFYRRISGERRRGTFYALAKFCFQYWRLDLKYGVDLADAHDAGYDCWVTSLVLHELIGDALESEWPR